MVQLSGKTEEMLHGFKAPHDAVKLGNGSILVNELGSKSLVRASDLAPDGKLIVAEVGEKTHRIDRPGEWRHHRNRRQPADRIAGRT